MEYRSIEVKIGDVDDFDVASALAFLSKFPQGTLIKQRSNQSDRGSRTLLVYHKNNKDQEPDFLVTAHGDLYTIEFNQRVAESAIRKIEEEINSDYTRD